MSKLSESFRFSEVKEVIRMYKGYDASLPKVFKVDGKIPLKFPYLSIGRTGNQFIFLKLDASFPSV